MLEEIISTKITTEKRVSKKKKVLTELLRICLEKRDFVFHNKLVKEVCKKIDSGNPFDITKLDNKKVLPAIMLDNDYAVIHKGGGYHEFVKGIDKVFHNFEPIQIYIDWNYQKSLLNNFNSSESNLLSVANNQRILHHFLFEQDTEFEDIDISKRPKTYFPHRTKTSFSYAFGDGDLINFEDIQIEIDLTIEFQGNIGVFEGKNGKPSNFSIYQIYHPFLYYHNANISSALRGQIKQIYCVYVLREKKKIGNLLKLWAYTFERPLDITSIKLIKSAAYQLIHF